MKGNKRSRVKVMEISLFYFYRQRRKENPVKHL